MEGIARSRPMRLRYFAGGREDVVIMHTERTDDLGNFVSRV